MLPHMREPKTCTEMATEKQTLPAPEEQVSPAAEDAQANPAVTARVPEPEMPAAGPAAEASAAAEEPVAEVADAPAESAVTETPAAETPAEEAAAERISGEEAAPRAKRARIKPAAGQEVAESEEDASRDVQVDFADEEAALAAQNAGLEIEGATPEEEAAEELAAQKPEEDKFAGKGKEELVALFARMLEEQPVQSIRRDVEALKIAFYRIRRAEVEAARRRFVEEGGAEEDFAPSVDGAEIQLKEQFKEYRRRRDAFIANLEAEKEANLKVKQAIIEELKELVRRAHELGLGVIMDLVHAHYVKNLNEGINELDGTDHTDHYTEDDVRKFKLYIQSQLAKIKIPNKDEEFLRERLLTMYANPARNYIEAARG